MMMMMPTGNTLLLLLCACLQVQSQDPCGRTHGCFRDPAGCYPASECTYFVSWTVNAVNETFVDFELSVDVGSGDKYAAVGLSQNNKMAQSDIYVCRSDQTLVRYYAVAQSIAPSDQRSIKGVYNIEVDPVVDGVLHCSFSRSIQLDDGDDEFFALNRKLYVLVAMATFTGDTISYHGPTGRWLTGEPVNLLAASSAESDLQLPRAQKAHGILMVIAWMFFASTGIVFARYMKPFLADKTLFGNKVWFNSHRICMISAFVCFAIAFIVIFAVKGEFLDSTIKSAFSHAIIGCIAVAFGTINPIMAIFRPHPGTPRRPYFNYAHRSVGILGWVFAMIAIILATDFYIEPLAPITDVGAFWTVIAFLIIGVAVILAFEIFDFTSAKQDSGPSSDIALQSPGDKQPVADATPAKPCERGRTIIFCVALLDIVICSIIMVVYIAQIEI